MVYIFFRHRLWRVYVVPGRLHVPKHILDCSGRAGRGHVVPGHNNIRVLRVFDRRILDRALGDDRRSVSQADQRNGRRRYYVHRPFLHIHRAADVSPTTGIRHEVRHVRRVRCRVVVEHGFFLLLLSGDQRQNPTGNRGIIREEKN